MNFTLTSFRCNIISQQPRCRIVLSPFSGIDLPGIGVISTRDRNVFGQRPRIRDILLPSKTANCLKSSAQ